VERLRGLMRRAVLRAMRPHTVHQEATDAQLSARIDELGARIDALDVRERVDPVALEERWIASDRMRAEVIQSLEVVRARVDDLDPLRSEVGDLLPAAEAVRSRPYAEGDPFETFAAPGAGTVLGFRDCGPAAPGGGEYVAFEDVFRGSPERIAGLQRPYLDLLADHAPVLDAGCGRGELLAGLRDRGVEASGVDLDAGMVARARGQGLDVREGDVVAVLEEAADESLGAIFSAQLVEHLPQQELRRFVALGRAKLRPGGVFVAETVNPHCPRALKAFWLDLTHQHPIFPEVMLVLCRIAGFGQAYVFHPMGTGDAIADRLTQDAYAVVATR
jgi:SAM-dependent methyltransferase